MIRTRPFVLVEGNIGAGKSTAAAELSKRLNLRLLEEPVDSKFLDMFYKDKARWGFNFQIRMLHARWAMQMSAAAETLVNGGYEGSILDRSLWGDYVFAEMLTESGHMHPEDFKTYELSVQSMAFVLFPPTTLLYLSAQPETCLARVRERNRPEEKDIDLDYLKRVHAGYQKMLRVAKTAFWPWSHAVQVVNVPWDPRTVSAAEWDRVASMLKETFPT